MALPTRARYNLTVTFPPGPRLPRLVQAARVTAGPYSWMQKRRERSGDVFSSHFGAPREGDSYVIRWAPGGVLEVSAAGQAKPPIEDKAFATAVFAIWLGEKPIQEDIKRDLVARAGAVLK